MQRFFRNSAKQHAEPKVKTQQDSSDKNNICPLVSSYFEEIDFPKDTKEYLNNLYEQVKPSFQVIKLKK